MKAKYNVYVSGRKGGKPTPEFRRPQTHFDAKRTAAGMNRASQPGESKAFVAPHGLNRDQAAAHQSAKKAHAEAQKSAAHAPKSEGHTGGDDLHPRDDHGKFTNK